MFIVLYSRMCGDPNEPGAYEQWYAYGDVYDRKPEAKAGIAYLKTLTGLRRVALVPLDPENYVL